MKRIFSVLFVLALLTLSFSACSYIQGSNMVDINRDSRGYVQFIADFNTGLFAYTSKPDFELAYYPKNQKLEKTFTYGSQDLELSADYQENKIIYTVTNPTDGRLGEMKTFEDGFNVYDKSWNNYVEKSKIGSISVSNEGDVKTLELTISGLMYTVTFSPLAEQPTIVYEIIVIA